MSKQDGARLAEPGAGIPALERWVAGAGIRALARFASRDAITRRFAQDAQRAIELARGVPEELGRRRVLIPRIAGMEDSSRDWSVYMTLEHLVIVSAGVSGLIRRLCAGREIPGSVRIQDVKPDEGAGPEQADALEDTVLRYGEEVAAHPDLRSAKRHPHPWFGPLNALQWHALAAVHNRIHRAQIEQILRRLRAGG